MNQTATKLIRAIRSNMFADAGAQFDAMIATKMRESLAREYQQTASTWLAPKAPVAPAKK